MLSTLMRYDFKRLFKWVLPSCGAMLLSAGLVRLLIWRLDNPTAIEERLSMAYALLIFALAMAIFGACFAIFAIVCSHFYKNLMTDEGYLTFTLPVTHNQILASKVISGSVCMLLGGAVALLSVLFLTMGWFTEEELELVGDVAQEILPIALPLSTLLLGIVELIRLVIQVYFAIVLGSVAVKTHKVAASIGFFYLTNFVINIVTVLVSGVIEGVSNGQADVYAMLGLAAFDVILCVILYLWSLNMLRRKLNLQ